MRICVIGVGGVGGNFGARLAAAGNSVAFMVRDKTLEAFNGVVVRYRRELGVATPMNRFIYAVLSPIEARARRGDLPE